MEKGLLIVRPCFKTGSLDREAMHDDICKQLEKSNVVVLPFGWDVMTKPSNTKIEVAEKQEEESTPWDFIDNSNYSPFDSQGKERFLFCTECGIKIGEYYDAQYHYCPYCGKRHYFEERKEVREWLHGEKEGE